jgi:NHL repeat-containing protein
LGGLRAARILVAALVAVAAGGCACVAEARPLLPSTGGYSGDGGLATRARLSFPAAIASTPGGGYLIADAGNQRIRFVNPEGIIGTVAGNGRAGFGGDGGPATNASLNRPTGVAMLADGGFVIADSDNNRVRLVSPDGVITTLAGNGTASGGGDDGPATAAQLHDPIAVSVTSGGAVLIADRMNDRIRRVSLTTGRIETVAGVVLATPTGLVPPTDGQDFSGPQLATAVSLSRPSGVVATADGGFLVADTGDNRVLRVSYGTATTVAGTGNPGFAGDGGPAIGANIATPTGLAVLPNGGLAFADHDNQRIREISRVGTIGTVAGSDQPGYAGSRVNATRSELAYPNSVTALTDGTLLVADTSSHHIRRIGIDGRIVTVAGRGDPRAVRPSVVGGFAFHVNQAAFRTRPDCHIMAAVFASANTAIRVSVRPRMGHVSGSRPAEVATGTHLYGIDIGLRPGRYRLHFEGRHGTHSGSDSAKLTVRRARACR